MPKTQQDKRVAAFDIPAPPPPPPPPENPTSKISPAVLNLKTAPPPQFFHRMALPSHQDLSPPPIGPYFFYGTLCHPPLLRQILNVDSELHLRPAKITGFECKLWGPYPALVDAGNPHNVVDGYVYRVETPAHAQRLAEYETGNYRAGPCQIIYTDGKTPLEEVGSTFQFVGDREDLDKGRFDLDVWLRRIGTRAGNRTPDRAANTQPALYEVYTVQFVGEPNHVAIYIETQPNEEVEKRKGLKYDVTGTILVGMEYRKQDCEDPILDATYVPDSKEKVATIATGDLERFERECCEATAPPASQVFLNGRRKDPSKPLYRCNHWADNVVKLAVEKGIFKT
ncbi:hypothetical protein BJX68DRAFT_269804 [Aspergillus pseudodeflectus]|uniref:Putative gamma-glutamylcyclotransferase n=1 Tax=Aspergillus pseudodeflectus TaxID=176178 RepID=A0ABR4JWU5_9EURO